MAEVAPDTSKVTEVVLYTCPTGGWVFGNRHPMEEAIKEQIPGCNVTHRVGWPFTAVVEINGTKGKREIGPFAFCAPAACHGACCSAEPTGKNALALANSLNKGSPGAVEAAR